MKKFVETFKNPYNLPNQLCEISFLLRNVEHNQTVINIFMKLINDYYSNCFFYFFPLKFFYRSKSCSAAKLKNQIELSSLINQIDKQMDELERDNEHGDDLVSTVIIGEEHMDKKENGYVAKTIVDTVIQGISAKQFDNFNQHIEESSVFVLIKIINSRFCEVQYKGTEQNDKDMKRNEMFVFLSETKCLWDEKLII
ncbi:hypothetical protein BpHYR1_001463 [Brachionus plicatilis]|uniref:Uncharacterized protein n=1 Tax=Brachionus plicatilis TaxID=10195 RepID=A0A3M7SQC0_BRAPC|nr:hypothetical protein BpHYR1_001463 [Brachionus plicatilis]